MLAMLIHSRGGERDAEPLKWLAVIPRGKGKKVTTGPSLFSLSKSHRKGEGQTMYDQGR
jgi:hypothetical protein